MYTFNIFNAHTLCYSQLKYKLRKHNLQILEAFVWENLDDLLIFGILCAYWNTDDSVTLIYFPQITNLLV